MGQKTARGGVRTRRASQTARAARPGGAGAKTAARPVTRTRPRPPENGAATQRAAAPLATAPVDRAADLIVDDAPHAATLDGPPVAASVVDAAVGVAAPVAAGADAAVDAAPPDAAPQDVAAPDTSPDVDAGWLPATSTDIAVPATSTEAAVPDAIAPDAAVRQDEAADAAPIDAAPADAAAPDMAPIDESRDGVVAAPLDLERDGHLAALDVVPDLVEDDEWAEAPARDAGVPSTAAAVEELTAPPTVARPAAGPTEVPAPEEAPAPDPDPAPAEIDHAPPIARPWPWDRPDELGGLLAARALTVARTAVDWLRRIPGETWLWIGIVALAAVLRYWGLGDKPLHHDESMHAFFSLSFARDPASYEYDPLLHGPFQFHAEGIVFAVISALSSLGYHLGALVATAMSGHASFATVSRSGDPWINDTTARLLPATTGVALVGITYGLRRSLGRVGAAAAAMLLAVSPAFVYFSRFLREDIYFAFFTYATVICAVQFSQKRSPRWLIATVVAFIFAYATKESIFLNMALWGSFLALLVAWEFGSLLADRLPAEFTRAERAFFGHAGPLLLLGAIGAAIAGLGLHRLGQLSAYINAHTTQTDAQVAQLENRTVSLLLYASIALAVLVIVVLLRQIYYDAAAEDTADGAPAARRRGGWLAGVRARLDPRRQPFMRLILGISWVNWFVAFVAGWVLFAALYWVVPGPDHAVTSVAQGFQVGVGRGIWQGLYYWIEQQQVARGGQPWYYYLLLIPLYEQLAVIFGLAGIVRALARPTRFRLFLVYWFVVSLVLYSWAGEKMPWLAIHILLPLMLLAGLALEWVVREVAALAAQRAPDGRAGALALALADVAAESDAAVAAPWERRGAAGGAAGAVPAFALQPAAGWEPGGGAAAILAAPRSAGIPWALPAVPALRWRPATAVLGALTALVLLVPMVYGMLVLSHQDAANGPHEMFVYVQTTPDVQRVMGKIGQADAALYGGQHQLKIAIGTGEEWPFYWYLRDYWLDPHPSTYVYWDYPVASANAPQEDVLILTEEDAATFMAKHPTGYHEQVYSLRSWWDEGYKPLPCIATATKACSASSQWGSGVGLGAWLSYGDTPPPNAHFNPRLAAGRLWNWLWHRTALGSTQGSYNFVFIVRNGVPIKP